MQLVKTLSVLALATGTVVAMPAHVQKRQNWKGNNRWWQRPSPDAVVTVTGYAPQPTDWNAASSSTSTTSSASTTTTSTTTTTIEVVAVSATPTYGGNFFNKPTPEEPAPTPTETPEASPAPAQTWAPAAPAAPSPTPSAAPAPSSGGASGGQGDYMSVVSEWRAAGGLPALAQDSTLEGNALKTSTDSVGGLIHELNPGTFAQVLAPGDTSDFESVYVGGWLCEIPSLAGLNGICSTMSAGWDHSNGETGHAEILSSTKYSKIGCAISGTGVWACDLA